MNQFEHKLGTNGFASINDVKLAIDDAIRKTDFLTDNRSGTMPTSDWICLSNKSKSKIRIDATLKNKDKSWGDGYERVYLKVSDYFSCEILYETELATLEELNSALDGIMIQFQFENWN